MVTSQRLEQKGKVENLIHELFVKEIVVIQIILGVVVFMLIRDIAHHDGAIL